MGLGSAAQAAPEEENREPSPPSADSHHGSSLNETGWHPNTCHVRTDALQPPPSCSTEALAIAASRQTATFAPAEARATTCVVTTATLALSRSAGDYCVMAYGHLRAGGNGGDYCVLADGYLRAGGSAGDYLRRDSGQLHAQPKRWRPLASWSNGFLRARQALVVTCAVTNGHLRAPAEALAITCAVSTANLVLRGCAGHPRGVPTHPACSAGSGGYHCAAPTATPESWADPVEVQVSC